MDIADAALNLRQTADIKFAKPTAVRNPSARMIGVLHGRLSSMEQCCRQPGS
jgi:hypothetical protein